MPRPAVQDLTPDTYEVPSIGSLSPSMAKITVIEEPKKCFFVHMDLLLASSTTLRPDTPATNDDSEQPASASSVKKAKITVSDFTSSVVARFVDWLYSGNCIRAETCEQSLIEEPKIYAFAYAYGVPQLQRYIVDRSRRSKKLLRYTCVKDAYELLPPDSAYLRLILDKYLAEYTSEIDDKHEQLEGKTLPAEFLYALVRGFAPLSEVTGQRVVTVSELASGDPCAYHDHADDKSRDACVQRKIARREALKGEYEAIDVGAVEK